MATPRLFQDLRLSLACLYSLAPSQTSHMDSRKAHDFLLHLQSRNVRRALHSIQQSNRDQQKKKQTALEDANNGPQLADEVEGSTWLACLSLLCCAQADSAERLFAAQTLMHRLRRAKLSEAIDLEIEDPNKYLSPELKVNLSLLANDYVQWMHQLYPLLGSQVHNFLADHPIISNVTDEEQLKGELALLTLATITYLTASHAQQDVQIQPLIFTLGNALAATALRLRYTPQSVGMWKPGDTNSNKATPASVPLVTMIVHSLSAAMTATEPNKNDTNMPLFHCLCSCLGTMPEALLSSGGGAMGRISIDPRCIQASHEELRQPATGVYLLWEALKDYNIEDEFIRAHLLATCQKWAKSLPLPQDFIEHTVPLAGQLLVSSSSPQPKEAALSYLIAIFETGSWTSKYILTFSLGLSSEQLSPQPLNKKKQSSRSKRRQKERIDSTATDDLRMQAEAECRHRGEMACRTARFVWEGLAENTRHSLSQSVDVGGEGPLGCLAACANACLPHWLRHSSPEDVSLAVSIMELFQEIASHSNRNVRALSYEPLYTLNTALLEAARIRYDQVPRRPPTNMETIVSKNLYQCTMRLATSCGYPSDYFDQLDQDNDEEIEVERNDVRDLIREVCGCEGDVAKGKTSAPMDVSMEILNQIMQSCSQACDTSLPPETAVHALSALAKPINVLADAYTNGYRCEGISETLLIPIRALGSIQRSVIAAFETMSVKEVFPVSRLSNLATAAFSPAISAMCRLETASDEVNYALSKAAFDTVGASVHAAALSIVHIPELTAESTLNNGSPYDIRGAMRGPGGEDHVGCLALSRLAFESDELASAMVKSSPSLALELCRLHNKLKSVENERGPGVSHGTGVAPKSRRILIQTICQIVMLDCNSDQEALAVLHNLFYSLVHSIAKLSSSPTTVNAEGIYRICEGVLDLSAFSPSLISEIFENVGGEYSVARQQFLHGVVQTCRHGYSRLPSGSSVQDEVTIQWSRLRGAVVSFLRASASPDLSNAARDAIILLNQCECQAIASQCALGPFSASPIFNEFVISDNGIPSGVFVHMLGEILEKQRGQRSLSVPNCIVALEELRTVVLETILLDCPAPKVPSLNDPRPTLCEAWYLTLIELISLIASTNRVAYNDTSTRTLLADSCCVALLLLLRVPLQRDRTKTPNHSGMSLDGPQTRAMLSFLGGYFSLGTEMLRAVAISLRHRLDLDIDSLDPLDDDKASQGLGILCACLFRAASGGLPPWAIESIPSLYSALFVGCGYDPDIFCRMLQLAMDVRLSRGSEGFGAVLPGNLLAGRYFESTKETSKATFVEKSREACRSNNAEGWRRFKVLLKQACGGKKKSSLSLKPSFTTWDVDRI